MWLWSGGAALVIGMSAFTLVLIPTMMWQYRQFGALSFARLLGTIAVSVYAAALVSYTQLPLPEARSLAWCDAHGVQGVQLTPFESFETMWLRTSEIGLGPMLTSQLGLQVIFNVVLMIPLGAIAVGFFRLSWFRATLMGFLVSLGIELTQATGVWGLYPCAYRLGDVDDLMTNTLGAFIGAILAPLFFFWMPRREQLTRSRLGPRPVTTGRRLASMVINVGVIWSASAVISVIIAVAWRFVNGTVDVDAFAWVQWAVQACLIVGVLFVPAIRGHGSLGQYWTWLAPRWRSSRGRATHGALWQRIGRTSVIGVPYLLVGLPGGSLIEAPYFLAALVSLAMIPFTRTRRSLSGYLTRAEIVDTRHAPGQNSGGSMNVVSTDHNFGWSSGRRN